MLLTWCLERNAPISIKQVSCFLPGIYKLYKFSQAGVLLLTGIYKLYKFNQAGVLLLTWYLQRNSPNSIKQVSSCPRRVNAGNKKHTQHAPSTKMECDYLNGWTKKQVTYAPKSGEPQRYSWGMQKKKKKNQAGVLLLTWCLERNAPISIKQVSCFLPGV